MPTILEIWLNMKSVLNIARQMINSELEPFEITSAEGDILFHLLMDNSGLSQEKLAERLDIDKAAVSRTISSLEKKNYIKRQRYEADGRVFLLTLTEKALNISDKIQKVYNDIYDMVKKDIGDAELQSLSILLQRVFNNLLVKKNKND